MTLTRRELESKLWQAADILRGQIDAADYKNYIFLILFLKRLSDRFDEEVESAVRSGVAREIALTDRDEHEFFVPETGRWSVLTGASMNLGEALNIASHAIEEANTPRLDGVLIGTNWNDESKLGSPANRERIIRSLLNHFSGLDLSDGNLAEDGGGPGNVLGDAYEYLIYQFADDAGKKGGEFYTPRSVVRLIVELLQPEEGMRICDPTAGSAGMLIYTADYVQEQGGDRRNLVLHGQERNLGTLAIGKLNLLLHGLSSARLEAGDVIAEPGLVDESGRLISYDRVIANPPFSLKSWGQDFAPGDPHHRFDRYGAIPPKTRGRFRIPAAHARSDELPGHGGSGDASRHPVPGRRGGQDTPRHHRVRPVRGGHRAGAQSVLRRQHPRGHLRVEQAKSAERRGKVLFVDAAQEGYFRQGKAQNFLDREHVDQIVDAYRRFETVERFAHVADLDEIEENDFNLNISRYVDTTEPVEVMSIEDALAELGEAERRRDEAVSKMDALLAEMGYAR